MADVFDTREIDKFEKDLIKIANEIIPKESKKFLREEGTKLRKKTLSNAKQKVKKKSGKYHKSIKRGKVYTYDVNGALSIRVYSNAPHAHLIEYGHRQVSKNGVESGFVEGKHVFEKSKNEFESEFNSSCEGFAEDILKELKK